MSVGLANPNVHTGAAHPNYSAAGTAKFIPELYAGKLLKKFYLSTIFGDIANTDYAGEISNLGDKVYIRTTPDITVSAYTKGLALATQAPTSPNVELTIDKAWYFQFVVEDVDAFQSDVKLIDDWTSDASTQMKIQVDSDILDNMKSTVGIIDEAAADTDFGAGSWLGVAATGKQITASNVLDFIVDAMTLLDNRNIPEEGRYVILPPWAVGMIKKSDLKDASLSGDGQSILRNGRVGMIDRATIYMSNNLPAEVDGRGVYFGQKTALTFASQFTKNETLRSERTFGHLVRGLQVYGWKVLQPTALGYGVIKR